MHRIVKLLEAAFARGYGAPSNDQINPELAVHSLVKLLKEVVVLFLAVLSRET